MTAKVATATAAAATVIRTERILVKLKILDLKRESNNKLFIKIKKIISLAFIV